MPVQNDLSEEERRMFQQHGVADLGEGGEPVADDGQQQQPPEQQGQQQEPVAHGDRRPNGQFASKEEREAAQQGQQPEGQQGQQPEGQQGEQQSEEGGEPKMVPLAALHEARQRAAQATRAAQLAMTRMNALLANQQGQGQQSQQQQMPDLTEDPVGYIQALEARLQQFEQVNQQTAQERQIDSALENDEAMFALSVPDYHDASDHYVQSRARELLAFYPPQQAQQLLLQEARQIAQQAWARGMSPAEMIYGLAQARGYAPGQSQPQGQQPQGQQQQGQQPRGPSAVDQVRAIGQAQQASRSLSGGGGSGQTKNLNAEAVLNMTDEEFVEYMGIGTKGANARFAAIGG